MKQLLFSLVIFSVLFVIGCQENSITDPLTNESVNKDQNPGPNKHGFISLEGMLQDPYPIMNSFYIISGQIEYDLSTVSVVPTSPVNQRYSSIYLTTDASFIYLCTVCPPSEQDNLAGFIYEVSEENVPVGGNYVSLLEKTFTIQGRDDEMVLKARFLVTSGGVELSTMWLALLDNNVVATNQTNN
jgi:hypothetical protein